MIPGLSPYSPAEVGADEYLARSALPPPPDGGEPWDAEPSPTASRGPFAVAMGIFVALAVVSVAAFIATLP